jgi:hypothetical protein
MYAFAVPIPVGKTEAVRRFNDECLGPRKAEYDDLQRRGGVGSESYWLQRDADNGDIIVVVSDSDQSAFADIFAHPQTDFDRWYRDQILDLFGIDLAEPWGPRNELLGAWQAS